MACYRCPVFFNGAGVEGLCYTGFAVADDDEDCFSAGAFVAHSVLFTKHYVKQLPESQKETHHTDQAVSP